MENYQGEVFIDGENLKSLSIKERAKKMAYVSQRSNAVDDFPVLDYLLFGTVNKVNFYQSPKEEDKKRVLDCAKQFGITHLIDKKLGEISGGERQRIILARSMLKKSKIVFIDEGLNQIDINLERKILKNSFKNYPNTTFVIVSHRLDNMDLYDKVIKMENGQVIDILKRRVK